MRRFAKLRFQGARFEGPVFPVEALPELAVYRDLVLEAAKSLWYADHPHRTNAPRGFDAAFALLLETIEEGSSMPVLVRAAVTASAIAGMAPDEAEDYFDRGRTLVEDIVARAAVRELPKDLMDPRLGPQFAKFGSKLKLGERIQLVGPAAAAPVGPIFTVETRDWILETIPAVYTEDVEYFGELVKADKIKHAFELSNYDGRRVPFDAGPEKYAELLTWMRDDVVVRLTGTAIYRTVGGFQRLDLAKIDMVQQDLGVAASAPCPLPISVQLADIAQLQDGWLDGDGTKYDDESIARARSVLEQLLAFGGISMPYVYPSPDHAIRAEWNHPDRDVVVILNSEATHLRLIAVNNTDEKVTQRETYNADGKGLKALATLLERLLQPGDEL